MKKLGLALLPLFAGCATGPATVAVEPAFCVASFRGPGGAMTAALTAEPPREPVGLRSLRTLTREDFSAQGCDVLLAVNDGGVETGADARHHVAETRQTPDCGLVAYSAYTKQWVWRSITGCSNWHELFRGLKRDLQPGQRSHGLVRSGLPPTLAEVESFAGPVPTREQRSAMAAAPVRERAAPVAAAPAPAPAPAEPFSDVDAPPAQGPVGRGHAVVIGIERYRESLPRADFAARDARVTAEYAKRVLGYPEANVAVLLDDRATRGDFEKYFERWLPNRVEKDDEVFIYFSGHGAPDLKTGDGYLVPYDGDPTYIEQTGYSLKRMYEALSKLPAKKVTVALDSCFSGAGGRSVIAKGARPLVAVTQSAVPSGLTVLSASAGDQTSNSLQPQGHGLFTYYFLKGLKEKGADFKAVFDYLKPEVAKVARREYNADQDPQWREGK